MATVNKTETKKETIHETLVRIQQELKAPKDQFNSFGNYKYRSCESILEAVKPLLNGCSLLISDEIVQLGDRYYIKAVVTLTDGKETITNTAYAREAFSKKGMDESQVTGATSSYARKYALNGLFLIDDTKDADSQDNSKHVAKAPNLRDDDPIMAATRATTPSGITRKCDHCNTVSQYHKKGCPNAI